MPLSRESPTISESSARTQGTRLWEGTLHLRHLSPNAMAGTREEMEGPRTWGWRAGVSGGLAERRALAQGWGTRTSV